ncbi:MAG: dTDP-4-amino-4,6-dideoxygalactose transaminase, partial [Bacteroidota bacterium]|nr:dTDP-4-amino-4,6-dideoxygalactose transaminase [Bacteroidota bacterium]
GKEARNIAQCVYTGQISGNGVFTKKCHKYFEEKFGFGKVLLTSSCTDALEMTAILCDIKPGDEVIMPSYTFVTTANAFELRGAKIIFADVEENIPNIDIDEIEKLITDKTKAIVVVHYAGVAVDMDRVMDIANKNNILVVEDAAHAIDSYYKGRALGSIGHFGTFSFHETKNIICGEGGMLTVNDERFAKRAEIIWEKGTNRAAFKRGEVDKYGWVDIGSSFLPSDLTAAFLFSQLESLDEIQNKRKQVWESYSKKLNSLNEEGKISIPGIPDYATKNGNMFYFFANSLKERDAVLASLKKKGVLSVFHYLPLHKSEYFKSKYSGGKLANTIKFSERIIRLPFYVELEEKQIALICREITDFYAAR